MTHRPLISIVTPVYNASAFIGRCLQSALAQSYPAIECILVNDASTDRSVAVAEEFLANHPRKDSVKILHLKANSGPSAARNTGVKASTGEYIYFLDSDDELPPDSLETLMDIADGNTDIAIGNLQVTGNKKSAYPALKLPPGIYRDKHEVFDSYLNKKWYDMAWNKLIHRHFFDSEDCWFEEGIVHEDTLWSFKVAAAADSLAVTGKTTYFYHIHEKSITQNKSEKNILDFYRVIEEIVAGGREQDLFNNYKSLVPYLDSLRIYFLKSLARFSDDPAFRSAQRENIDNLFRNRVRPYGRESLSSKIKSVFLFLRT